MYLPPANFQQFTINDYDSVTVLVMTFFTVGFQPEGAFMQWFRLKEHRSPSTFLLPRTEL